MVAQVVIAAAHDLVEGSREEIERPGEGVVGDHPPGQPSIKEDIATAAVRDATFKQHFLDLVGDAGDQEVRGADGGGEIRVGSAAEGRVGSDVSGAGI